MLGPDDVEPGAAIRGFEQPMALASEEFDEHSTVRPEIIDDEDGRRGRPARAAHGGGAGVRRLIDSLQRSGTHRIGLIHPASTV